MAIQIKHIIVSDRSGREIQPTTDQDAHPKGYIVHGNIYVAGDRPYVGLVGTNFPSTYDPDRVTTVDNKLVIDGVGVDFLTPDELLDQLRFDPCVVLQWAQERIRKADDKVDPATENHA